MRRQFHSWFPIVRACALVALTATASRQGMASPTDRPAHPVTCSGAVQHPIVVRIEALDPVRRGASVRLRVTATSRIPLDRGRTRLLDAGGATVLGAREAALGRVTESRGVGAEFRVQVPADGRRALIQWRVEGEGPAGRIGRGATFNLVPDGTGAPVRVVAGANGQQVAEYESRRID